MTRIHLTRAGTTISEGWTEIPAGHYPASDSDAECFVWEAGNPPANAECEAADLRVRTYGVSTDEPSDRHGEPDEDGIYAICRTEPTKVVKVQSIRSYALWAFPAGVEYRYPHQAEEVRIDIAKKPCPAGYEVEAYHADGTSYRMSVVEGSTARLVRRGDVYTTALWEIVPGKIVPT